MTAALQYALIYAAFPVSVWVLIASVWPQRGRIAEIFGRKRA